MIGTAARAPRIWRFGDGVNTDDILPGRYAPYLVGEDRFHTYAFAHLRPEFASEVRPGDVLVGGRNWGLGSSREYAPRALKRLGVAAIIAGSFARIHYRNLLNLGMPVFEAPEQIDALPDGAEVELDFARAELRVAGAWHRLPPPPHFAAEIVAAGSILAYVARHGHLPGQPPDTDPILSRSGTEISADKPERSMPMQTIDTPYGRIEIEPERLELGELLVTDEGAELEVVALDPLRLEPAPEEEEDWGE